jgi:hypothetical protein
MFGVFCAWLGRIALFAVLEQECGTESESANVFAITRRNAAGEALYCVCNEPWDAAAQLANRPMVLCVECQDWYVWLCVRT